MEPDDSTNLDIIMVGHKGSGLYDDKKAVSKDIYCYRNSENHFIGSLSSVRLKNFLGSKKKTIIIVEVYLN